MSAGRDRTRRIPSTINCLGTADKMPLQLASRGFVRFNIYNISSLLATKMPARIRTRIKQGAALSQVHGVALASIREHIHDPDRIQDILSTEMHGLVQIESYFFCKT